MNTVLEIAARRSWFAARCATGIILFLLLVRPVNAQVSPRYYDYARPSLDWYSIDTEHFNVLFHANAEGEGSSRTAQVVARIAEEIYGPVTTLYRFTDIQAAIRRANATDYGLQAAVFTASLATARQAADGLDFGGVMINDSTDFRIDAMPFGGRKRSGLGREGVRFALEEMTEPKVVCFS